MTKDLSPSLLAIVNRDDGDPHSVKDQTTKKVRFKTRARTLDHLWAISHRPTLDHMQLYPSVVLAWIQLPGLPGFLFSRQIVEAIRELIGKVAKLDFQTDNRSRGCFARLVVYLDLEKPLISQALVDGAVQRVEYEALPTVCFSCKKYGHVKDLCLEVIANRTSIHLSEVVKDGLVEAVGEAAGEAKPDFGPWMLVERRSWQGLRNAGVNKGVNNGAISQKEPLASRFSALMEGVIKAKIAIIVIWLLRIFCRWKIMILMLHELVD
ncbi:hypothetical protein PVK06_007083 [Gossypium arboreum]|uniref:DUF4283 domain-containing protein n=1 Tax=Gossypium arboreum TaxID=29729 RepID=A0ABR0QH59_GOSAR|nr:hypothetical protein PVK06_007083 [Gossypium arboreum]